MQIDAVVLWVDGGDVNHQKKMMKYLGKDVDVTSRKVQDRFNQVEEIEFTIKSIIKNAPYIENIYLVTDNQIPTFLKKEELPKVKLIDHMDIFGSYQKYLPTFNCLPIETVMANIPNLSEHFIYFNDDCFLINKTKETDFFVEGNPVLRGNWTKFYEDIWIREFFNKVLKKKKRVYGYKLGQQNIAKSLGFKKYFKFDHTPHPLRKSTIKKYFEEHPGMEELNVKHRFRHPDQFTLQGLANHIEIKNKTCVLKNDYQLLYIQSYKKALLYYKTLFFSKRRKALFMCLQSLDKAAPNKLAFFKEQLTKIIK